jgi:hypothetical protein
MRVYNPPTNLLESPGKVPTREKEEVMFVKTVFTKAKEKERAARVYGKYLEQYSGNKQNGTMYWALIESMNEVDGDYSLWLNVIEFYAETKDHHQIYMELWCSRTEDVPHRLEKGKAKFEAFIKQLRDRIF